MAHEERGEDNLACDEVILDPDKLAKLLYDSQDGDADTSLNTNIINNVIREDMYKDVRDSDDYDSITSYIARNVSSLRHVTPVDEEPVKDDCDNNKDDDSNDTRRRLPPVQLQKVQSEDLSWLDTIIKHNSLDECNPPDFDTG